MMGEAIDGELKGEQLQQLPSYNAFWFSASAFFPGALIFNDDDTYEQFDIDQELPDATNNNDEDADFPYILIIPMLVILSRIIKNTYSKKRKW